MQKESAERIVLVTGGSRGVGAETAQRLAAPATHVVVHYRNAAQRAQAVVDAITDAGGRASSLRADIADEAESAAMVDTIAERFGRLDAVVLNASVHLEPGTHAGHAMRINREAQRRLAVMGLPLIRSGGRIVFVTNHQAHFYPLKAVPKGQTALAAGRWAGETTLYAMRSEFHRAGVHFTVVSGDSVDASFADAVVNAVNTASPTGMVYVGGPEHRLIA
ncbi:short-chain dehydrogenase [Mycolicibacterium elephantis]|uniref:SDR family oxidoreductase n=1 Tax=Mycolicibacterium elephantis TaxID=81858 RepID=UPI0007EBCAD9|nr:SDR family oxidoreductase [Mycolicibacterium elephantis]OBE98216.1 short-chain dehydrogenase [Mycolicibacterium elephantis]